MHSRGRICRAGVGLEELGVGPGLVRGSALPWWWLFLLNGHCVYIPILGSTDEVNACTWVSTGAERGDQQLQHLAMVVVVAIPEWSLCVHTYSWVN